MNLGNDEQYVYLTCKHMDTQTMKYNNRLNKMNNFLLFISSKLS